MNGPQFNTDQNIALDLYNINGIKIWTHPY